MKINFKTLGTVLVVTLFTLSFAVAQPGPHGRGGKGHGMGGAWGPMGGPHGQRGPMELCMKLDLTDEQVGQLVDLHAAHVKEMVPMKREQHEIGKELRELKNSSAPDEKQLKKLMGKMADLKADMLLNSKAVRAEALKVLTDDQKTKLGDHPIPFFGGPRGPHGKGHGGKFMGKRGMRRGGCCDGDGPWWMDKAVEVETEEK